MRKSSLATPARVAVAVVMTLSALVGVLSTSVSSASAHGTAADPTVTGPILPSDGIQPPTLATTFPLAQLGYTQSEYFLSGTATSYVPTAVGCQSTCTAGPLNGQLSVTPHSTAPYTSRVVVFRPRNPNKFNGTVIVEWLNVTGGLDDAPDWVLTHNELIRDGFAWVGVSAQAVGVNALKTSDPARYGSLSHPGDSYSYDIFSQAGQAVWDNPEELLGGLTPQHVIAAGESQSAGRLTTYIDAVAPLVNVYDGYLVHSRIGTPSPLSQAPQPTVTVPTSIQFRTDISAPVFEFETETDVSGTTLYDRQPNTNQFRLWEVAGGSHFDYYGLFVGPTDTGDGQGAIAELGRDAESADLNPRVGHLCQPNQHQRHALGLERGDLVAQSVGGQRHRALRSLRSCRSQRRQVSQSFSPLTPLATSLVESGHRRSMRRSRHCAASGTPAGLEVSAASSVARFRSAQPNSPVCTRRTLNSSCSGIW